MKNMLQRRNPTIKQKLIALVAAHLLLFSVLFFVLFLWFESVLEEKTSELAQQTTATISGNMQVYLNNNIRLANSMASDSSVLRLLRQNPDFSTVSSMWGMVELLNELKSFSVVNRYIYSISIYNPASNKVLSTTDGIYDTEAANMQWADSLLKQNKPLSVEYNLNGAVPGYNSTRTGSMVSVTRVLQGKDTTNILMIQSDPNVLELFVGDTELWAGTGIVITDYLDKLVYITDDFFRQYALSDNMPQYRSDNNIAYRTVTLNDEKYIMVQKTFDVAQWDLKLFIPHERIMKDVLDMRKISGWIAAVLAGLGIVMTTVLYVQIFNPIRRMVQSISAVEKGMPIQPVKIKRMDELGYLQQRFNEMMMTEQKMRRTILEEQLHKKDIELKFLQSQVNPHFLYNTLDSIYWLAEEKGMEEIGEVVLDLSRFFRLSLSRGQDFVTIRQTIEHLQYYIRIQQFRHADKFEVEWSWDQTLADVKIMKLMLQPVVENAIVHGMEQAAGPCQLSIHIERVGNILTFRVKDTGAGIERQQLKGLLQEIQREGGISDKTYGLRNLYQRLRILYGERMDFFMESSPGEGTTVEIQIMMEEWGGAADDTTS